MNGMFWTTITATTDLDMIRIVPLRIRTRIVWENTIVNNVQSCHSYLLHCAHVPIENEVNLALKTANIHHWVG